MKKPEAEKLINDTFTRETVAKEFFEQYKNLYLRLKGAIGEYLTKDAITRVEFEAKGVKTPDFAKRLLGQIVFLYFLQRKGWLGVTKGRAWGTGPKDFLQRLYDRKLAPYNNFFNDILEPLFYEALATERTDNFYQRFDCRIPFLNGGLFEPICGYDWVNTDILLDNAIFKGILEVFDLYNFTVREEEPLDKEVAVDPEMLGRVFENLLPENERKGSGTYYTPREIVQYMCQESLINYLDAKLNIQPQPIEDPPQCKVFSEFTKVNPFTAYEEVYIERVPRQDLAEFIYHGEVAQEHEATAVVKSQYEKIYTGAYQSKIPENIRKFATEIDEALANVKICDPAIGSGAFPVGMMNEIVRARSVLNAYLGDASRTSYEFKRHAIQESIYGADLESSAVDIAKLRLWLSLIVDEDDIKPLPNLEYKIVTGNSLLGFPFDTSGFELNQGFDIVIANPPYVDSEKMVKLDRNYRELLKSIYASAKGNWDLFVVFIDKGISLLNQTGTLFYIIPNKLLAAPYAAAIREIISNQTICEIRDYSCANVFTSANVYPIVIGLTKYDFKRDPHLVTMSDTNKIMSDITVSKETLKQDKNWNKYFGTQQEVELLLKLKTLENLSNYVAEITAAATVNEAYLIKEIVCEESLIGAEESFKLINTGTIDPYKSLWGINQTQYIKAKYKKPVVSSRNLEKMNKRRKEQASFPKLIIAGMSKSIECFHDMKGEYLAGKSTTVVFDNSPEKLAYICGLFNSRLISFWLNKSYNSLKMAGGYINVSNNELKQVPFKPLHESVDGKKIIELVKSAHIAKDDTTLSILISKIDQLVYKIYGLTPEEIALIECSEIEAEE
ncbi:MAG: N-6 DNA methylase [Chloroflexi bacterium]|nr:N-6 DNA methylase [Chloroflexota bacterium]